MPPPLQDAERAARAAARAVNDAAAAATKQATGTTSRHHGVHWDSGEGKWHVQVKHGGKVIHSGWFDADKEDDAGKEADKWMRANRKEGHRLWKLNFDSDGERVERQSTDSSKFRGVHKVKKTGRWEARIWDGKDLNLGNFATQKEAAEDSEYDVKALELGKPTNFNQYGECNPEVHGKVVPQHDKRDGRGTSPRPRGRR